MSERIVEEIKTELPSILAGDSEKLVNNAVKLGMHLGGKQLSTSQIRRVFSEIKQMGSYDKNRLNLLRPKMAYTAARHGKNVRGKLVGAIVDLQEVLDEGIKMTNNEVQFRNFKEFFEAILAYHRYYGGGE